MKLIVNADDFGLTKGVNQGIISAHRMGIVTSTTMMMNGYAVRHAVDLSRYTPQLGIGVHLVLTTGRPLSAGLKTLTDSQGNFKSQTELLNHPDVDLDEVYREFQTQIKAFLALDLKPTHLDSHHHIQSFGSIADVVLRLGKEYNLPVRNKFHEPNSYNIKVKFFDDFYAEGVSTEYFTKYGEKLLKYDIVELMTHPALADELLMKVSSYNLQRRKEYDVLINKEIRTWIKTNKIELINYKNRI